MFNTFRTHQQPLLIAMTAIAIIAFVWLYNPMNFEKARSNTAGVIYGRQVKTVEIEQYRRKSRLAQELGMYELMNDLSYGMVRQDEEGFASQFAWNSIVVNHEAEKLGIYPTHSDATLKELEKKRQELPQFQTNGQYDDGAYKKFLIEQVTPKGFTEEQLYELLLTEIRLKRLKELIEAPVGVASSEVKGAYARHRQKIKMQAVAIGLEELKKDLKPTDEEISKAYEEKKAQFTEPASREVEYVAFLLNEEQKKLTGKEKVAVQQSLYKQASEFTQKMLEANADFAKNAAAVNAKVEDAGTVPEGGNSEKMPSADRIDEAVVHLTAEDPNSDVLQGTEGFYVLHLKTFKPTRQKTLEETREQIVTELINTKAREMAQKKADEIRKKLEEEVKAGKSFADAAAAAGLQLKQYNPFSMSEPDSANPEASSFSEVLATAKAGEVTKVVNTSDGFAIGFVQERLPLESGKFKEIETQITESISTQKKMALFHEWLKDARDAAKLDSKMG